MSVDRVTILRTSWEAEVFITHPNVMYNGTRPRFAKFNDLYYGINPFLLTYQDFPNKTQMKVLESELCRVFS